MNFGMNYLREHLPLEMRFHYVTSFGGNQPNVVPPEARVALMSTWVKPSKMRVS